jgi:hypothetical protein
LARHEDRLRRRKRSGRNRHNNRSASDRGSGSIGARAAHGQTGRERDCEKSATYRSKSGHEPTNVANSRSVATYARLGADRDPSHPEHRRGTRHDLGNTTWDGALSPVRFPEEFADVAQLVEQLIRNQQVSSSNLLVGSSFKLVPQWDELFFARALALS